jgi:5-formyltetrahydrofolate cyclo-ligase
MDAGEAKRAWRRLAAALSGLTSREDREERDAALAEQVGEYVREYAAACGAKTILGYAPLPDEPDVLPFLRGWLADGGALALPVWKGGPDMTLRLVDDIETDLRPGRASIREPADFCSEVSPEAIDLALVPGRFFSESCQRLGRGAGCYDRLLRGRRMYRVGVCYDYQVLPRLPVDQTTDEEMDMIVTPARIIVNAHAQQGERR